MIMDLENIVSDQQSLAIAQGTALSTYSIDRGVAGTPAAGFQATGSMPFDLNRGQNAHFLVQVTTEFDSAADNTTLKVEVVEADNAALDSNLVVLQSSNTIAQAALLVGYQFRVDLPPGTGKRYVGLRYTIGTADATAGKVTAGLVLDKQTNPSVG